MQRITLFIVTLLCFTSEVFAQGQSISYQGDFCGNSARANIVMMIDITGSISKADLDKEKAAAKELLDYFASAQPKPKVAIGTFNGDCTIARNCNGNTNMARIVGQLTQDYAQLYPLLSPTGGIKGGGTGGDGSGWTNVSESVRVSQDHLDKRGYPGWANYIILIADGMTNMDHDADFRRTCGIEPSGTPCFCPLAVSQGASSASAAKNAGTDIFTVHFGKSMCAPGATKPFNGVAYLRDVVSSGPGYAFESGNDLSGIFSIISEIISCDDGRDCTIDSCNPKTNYCEYREKDSDGDGVGDCDDLCKGDDSLIGLPCDGPDADNCPTGKWVCDAKGVLSCTDDGALDDRDGDGTPDCEDLCPDDPKKIKPMVCGCGVSDKDTDGDGTPDCNDKCKNDPNKILPGLCGCGVSDADTDGDGTPDCRDQCPADPKKIKPGICDCGVSDKDSDGDGKADCLDLCPQDPNKVAPGVCGCGVSDSDTDGDGVPDCIDACPSDPNKTEPGACGCGKPDTDTDGDGSPNCKDNCPDDPEKTEPGDCGCGVTDTDRDGDGTPDCVDNCPDDPNKTEEGLCGCGVSDIDTDGDGIPDCDEEEPIPAPDCDETNIFDTLLALDGNAASHRKYVLRSTKMLRRNAKGQGPFIREVETAVDELYTTAWVNTWRIPSVVVQCDETIQCVNVAHEPFLNQYSTTVNQMHQLLLDVVKRLRKARKDKAAGERLVGRSEDLLEVKPTLISQVPDFHSECKK